MFRKIVPLALVIGLTSLPLHAEKPPSFAINILEKDAGNVGDDGWVASENLMGDFTASMPGLYTADVRVFSPSAGEPEKPLSLETMFATSKTGVEVQVTRLQYVDSTQAKARYDKLENEPQVQNRFGVKGFPAFQYENVRADNSHTEVSRFILVQSDIFWMQAEGPDGTEVRKIANHAFDSIQFYEQSPRPRIASPGVQAK